MKRAFSLIEVMIASAMLGIGLAAVMSAYGSAASLESHQERVTSALHLAESRMEDLLLLYPDASELTAATHGPLGFTRDGAPAATTPFFQVGWTVSAGPIPRSRRLEVTVTWAEPRGAQSLTLVSHRS